MFPDFHSEATSDCDYLYSFHQISDGEYNSDSGSDLPSAPQSSSVLWQRAEYLLSELKVRLYLMPHYSYILM